ncbi:MAG: nitroreductase family protein [Steroidobacteraceae bacterium]
MERGPHLQELSRSNPGNTLPVTAPSVAKIQAPTKIPLPLPASQCRTSVFAALEQRQTIREISATPLPLPLISTLLWAADGVNRKTGPFGAPGRTAASASNSQEIDIYVALPEAAYLYEARSHTLILVAAEDLRGATLTPGQRGVAAHAPVQLIYAADVHRLTHTVGFQEPGLHDPEVQKSYYYLDTGLIAGNVYLFAAAEGLAAWFHNCDRGRLAHQLRLSATQHVLFAQSVGYPACHSD